MRKVALIVGGAAALVSGALAVATVHPVAQTTRTAFVCQIKGDPDGLICKTVYTAASVVCNQKHPCG
jgi:hypothetical protein